MSALKGKAAIVTGGSRGIGRAIVERLAADGAMVVFNYASSEADAAAVEREVDDAGGKAYAVRNDVTKPGAVDALMHSAAEYLDGLDILVNNVGHNESLSLSEISDELWQRIMDANVGTVFRTMRHASHAMSEGGRIINISTVHTVRPAPGLAAYVASKGAIEQLTKVAAIELGARGITVNAVSPGVTDTDPVRSSAIPESVLEQIAAITALGRLGQPRDIADVVGMLVSDDARWLTGQIIPVTGGLF